VGINARIIFSAFTAALAGFLFGFDTVVISGAEQKIQALWSLGAGMHGIAMASALYGTVIGSLCGGWPTDRFGRRATLLWIGILYLVSALGSALAGNVYELIAARLIGGLGIGISTVAAPLYIAEIAPPAYRGRLAGMFQFNIVLGIVIAYLSNALLAGTGENAWRWMMGVAAFPSLLYSALCLRIAESPRWLLGKMSDRSAGMAALRALYPRALDAEIEELARQICSSATTDSARHGFWTQELRSPILLAVLVAMFNQLSGINAILYFAPRIFELTGLSEQAALLQSVGIGITNLIFTFIGLWLIDRIGRRTLLFAGSFGYIVSLSLTAWAFFTAHFSIVPACIFIFIASHAVGQGAVIWVLISEIFPNQHRAEGQALGSFTHWSMAALVTSVFPTLVSVFAPGYVFAFFCAMMILQLIWVKTMVVETKGVPLEQVTERLGLMWYSGRVNDEMR
jgi:SP family arabinose:H+ symporter-like MFS transporter